MKLLKQYLALANIRALFLKKVIQNILRVGIVTLLLEGLGLYEESVIAANFVLSEVIVTFFFGFFVLRFIINIFIATFEGFNYHNYISLFKTSDDVSSFKSAGFFTTLVKLGLFAPIAFLFPDVYLETFFPGQPGEYFELVVSHF